MAYYMDDVVDTTGCKCGYKVAEIVVGEHGYYAACPVCDRVTKDQFDTIEEAVSAFKKDDECEYQ